MFMDRAVRVAANMTIRQRNKTGVHLWEHYTSDWEPDLDYNRNDNSNSILTRAYRPDTRPNGQNCCSFSICYRPEPWRLGLEATR